MLALDVALAPTAVAARARHHVRSGFRPLPRRRVVGAPSLPLLSVAGAAWAFEPDRRLVASAVEAPAPVEAPAAPVAAPVRRLVAGCAGALVERSAPGEFLVEVVDLDADESSFVRLSAASPRAAAAECRDDELGFLPVAVFALLPGGAEELVWAA